MMLSLNSCVLYWKPATFSLVFLMLICLTNKLFVLPITGIYLIIYVLTIGILTTWFSFITLQNFLQQNKSLELENWLKLKCLPKASETNIKEIGNVKNLTLEIEEYYIKKWFTYISKDTTFNDESKVILEEILRKVVNVQFNLDNQIIIQGVLNLYLKHLKQFRRSLKRKEKYSGKISELYYYSHTCSSSTKSKDFFLNKLTTNLLNHFISWELANSLPYQILVSIISKSATTYILNLLSNPEFFNYYLLSLFASETEKRKLNLSSFNRVKIIKITENGSSTPSELSKSLSKSNLITPQSSEEKIAGESITSIPKLQENESESKLALPIVKNFEEMNEEVKIHEAKSCKTWYDSYDLNSVTFGQDILTIDSMAAAEADTIDHPASATAPEDIPSPISSAKLLLDEMKQITNLETFKTSMKPISDVTVSTYHNIRDFQETITVNSVVKPVTNVTTSALHKIGGLHLQDEAAGVVEGILDFGRTKIRKGLRLTGLQDNPVEGSDVKNSSSVVIPQNTKKNIVKLPRVKSQGEDFETTWFNPLQEEAKVVEIESNKKIPSILTQDESSPDPEYEEAGDLASSIAKLRSLLEQKSSESNLSTPSALSPMPPDEITSKLLLESEDVDEADGMMPSFYKFCAKTATGVIHNTLNTIKTALPGNVTDCDRFDSAEKWLFIESNSKETDLFVRMDKLLCERKVFCTVDTAYEAIDSLGALKQNEKQNKLNIQFEDELDDFEVRLPVTKALFDIFSELLADCKDTPFSQEPVIKSVLLLFGNVLEEQIVTKTKAFLNYWSCNATIPKEGNVETLSLELDAFIESFLSGIPDYFKYLIGEKTLKEAVNLFIYSLQVQKINQDVLMQIFEIVCIKLMEGSKQLSPLPA